MVWALSLTAAGGRAREGEKALRSKLFEQLRKKISGTASGGEAEDAAGSPVDFTNLLFAN